MDAIESAPQAAGTVEKGAAPIEAIPVSGDALKKLLADAAAARNKARLGQAVARFLAGAALGAFVGLLLALKVGDNSVVASVTSALMALVSALAAAAGGSDLRAGSSDKPAEEQGPHGARSLMLVGFGAAACLAMMLGLEARTHNAMGRKPADVMSDWEAAGFSKEDSRRIAALQFGIDVSPADSTPPAASGAPQAAPSATSPPSPSGRPSAIRLAAGPMASAGGTLLLSTPSSDCDAARNALAADDATALAYFRATPAWRGALAKYAGNAEHEQAALMRGYVESHCK